MAKSKAPDPGGRPTTLTPELQALIVQKLHKGMPLELAAESCGIPRSTVHGWIHRGEGKDKERPATEPYAGFADACRRAKALGAELYLNIVLEAATGFRRSKTSKKVIKSKMSPMRVGAAQWMLARRWPEFFGSARESLLVDVQADSGEKKAGMTVIFRVLPPDATEAAEKPVDGNPVVDETPRESDEDDDEDV